MLRYVLKLISAIIVIYITILIVLTAFFLTKKHLYEDYFPLINEHSYVKIDNNYLEPTYKKNDYVFVKKTKKIKEGDFVVYLEDEKIVKLKKVTNVDQYLLTLDYTNHDEQTILDVKDIIGKVVYSNKTLSKVLHIITNPIIIIILFVASVFLPELAYRRYD